MRSLTRTLALIAFNSLFYLMISANLSVIAQDKVAHSKTSIEPEKHELTKKDQKALTRFNESVENYQLNIEELESKEGAYGQGVSQALLALGTLFQQNDKHTEAIKNFRRSLHLKRINEGLYGVGQIPIVERLINSLSEQKQWNSVDNRFRYLNWLYQRNYSEDALEVYPIKMQMGNWYLKSFTLKRAAEPTLDLINSYIAYNQAYNIQMSVHGQNDIRVLNALRGSLLVNYLLATTQVRAESISVNGEGEISSNMNSLVSKVSHMKQSSLRRGISLISHEIEIYLAQPTIDYSLVTNSKLKMADWYLMFGKRKKAMDHYQSAYHYLAKHADDGQVVEEIFSQPVVLPNFENMSTGTSLVLAGSKPADDVDYVHASLDITRYGTAQNVEIVESNLTNNAKRSRVLRSLRKAKYRPKISEGNVIATAKIQLHVFP